MVTQRISIGGVIYGNVGEINTEKEPVYRLNVRTLDGTLHQELRYIVTTHTVQFFNLLDGVYDSLKAYIKANKNVPIECGLPIDNGDIDNEEDFDFADYKITIEKEINKGYFKGKYFRNGLTLRLEAVNADE